MRDYANLKKYVVTKDNAAEYVFSRIEGEPSIWVKPATDDNADWLAARLRQSLEDAEASAADPTPRGKEAPKPTPESIAAEIVKNRDLDKRAIADSSAIAWGTAPVDASGESPEFNADECYDFLCALPDYMFDPFRNFCGNVYNFIGKKADPAKLGN